jgi:hypothetical protein
MELGLQQPQKKTLDVRIKPVLRIMGVQLTLGRTTGGYFK